MSRKIILSDMLRGFFVACVCTLAAPASAQSISPAQPYAKGLEESVSEVHDDGEMILTVLSDQTHVLDAVLKGKTAVHYYSFTSVRGQDVLVSNAPGCQVHRFGSWNTSMVLTGLKNLILKISSLV